ncbi:hypothetical protein H7J81_18485 [Mycobacterium cookii]|nr:DUF6653 family protein [Mycobacterium cookii]MCV7332092.1 hypothetical protein [Mycobacterium cookii]
MRRAMFARHANPWSAWSRWASTPLVLLPVWTRRRSHTMLVALWLALNPIIFPKVSDERPWSTRAMLGEELWISSRPKDGAAALSVATSMIAVLALVEARRHRAGPAAVATAAQMVLTLVYWQQMVRYLERHR